MRISSIMLAAACVTVSCSYFFPEEKGELNVFFSKEVYLATKAREEIPDTNSFILTVTSAKGTVLYDGVYGAAPQPIITDPGTYTVKVASKDMPAPAFSAPVYGDECLATVNPGESTEVRLICTQTNAGIRLLYSSSFREKYPDASVRISADSGSLIYGQKEDRIAYFPEGTVRLLLNSGGESLIGERVLRPRDMITLEISAAAASGGTVSVQVDTSRNWSRDSLVVGGVEGAGGGTSMENALSVNEARGNHADEIWVYGYIVGGDLSSSKASFSAPFSSKTNLVLADKSSCRDRDKCLSIQLRQGDIRDALNLVDNPGLLGRQVFLKGKPVPSYYGIPGIQELSEYYLSPK